MRINMAIQTPWHLFMHYRRMRLTMATLTLRHGRMGTAMTERAGKRLVLGLSFCHIGADLLVARHTEGPRRGFIGYYLQRMMDRMTGKTIGHNLAYGMRLVTLRTIRNLTVDIMAEGT